MSGSSITNIQRRISSISGIYKITQAMEMVATSKITKAKHKAIQADDYFGSVYNTLITVFKSVQGDTAFEKINSSPKACYILIAGDRGFAGGYNNNILQKIKPFLGTESCYITIGKKATSYLKSKNQEILYSYDNFVDCFSVKDSFDIANTLINCFLNEEFSSLHLIYTNYASMVNMTPTIREIMPLPEIAEDSSHKILFEPSIEEIVTQVMNQYISGLLYGGVCHSVAAEVSSRKLAMDNANKNAKKLIEDLYISYNRARQEIITTQISEITSNRKRRTTPNEQY